MTLPIEREDETPRVRLTTPPADWLDEIVNISLSQRLRWAEALKGAGEFDLAEEVFPDTPEETFTEHRRAA